MSLGHKMLVQEAFAVLLQPYSLHLATYLLIIVVIGVWLLFVPTKTVQDNG